MQFQQAKFVASYGTYAQIPPCDSIEVAFAGRSNVGKSTLINRIFQRKALARVSSVPGKTATINFYRVDPLTVVDLSGIRLCQGCQVGKRAVVRTDLRLSGSRS